MALVSPQGGAPRLNREINNHLRHHGAVHRGRAEARGGRGPLGRGAAGGPEQDQGLRTRRDQRGDRRRDRRAPGARHFGGFRRKHLASTSTQPASVKPEAVVASVAEVVQRFSVGECRALQALCHRAGSGSPLPSLLGAQVDQKLQSDYSGKRIKFLSYRAVIANART